MPSPLGAEQEGLARVTGEGHSGRALCADAGAQGPVGQVGGSGRDLPRKTTT